jgi:hypothetical protein
MKRTSLLILGVLALFLTAVVAFPAIVGLVTDWWWFRAVGFETVFVKSIVWKMLVGASGGLFAFVFLYVNLRLAQRGAVPDPIVVNINSRASNVDITRGLRVLGLPLSILLALLISGAASSGWLDILRFFHGASFGVQDPVFSRDIAYYVFSLPAISGVIRFVQALTIASLFVVVLLYVLRGDIVTLRNRITVEPSAQMHLGLLVALAFLTSAAALFFVRIPGLVYSTTGDFVGASHSDLLSKRPGFYVLSVVAVVCAGWVLVGARRRTLPRSVSTAVLGYIVLSVLAVVAFPAAVQRLIVLPNELARERPQIQSHLTATRQAWKLDEVEVRVLSGETQLTSADIEANRGTIRNVRLWDRDQLLQTFGQLQAIRTYYDFRSVDDDRYWIEGEYRQVLLSPRELNTRSLTTRTFINERLTFTHGMGVTLSPVNEITPEGLPYLFVQDLPPTSSVDLNITRPEIYYGELSNDYVFVGTNQAEFDYPLGIGDSSAFTSYRGSGGVPVGGMWRRLLYGIRFGSLKSILSQDITVGSRIQYHRNVRERAAKALPFLSWDADPYIVITDDGRLKWILDAYTVTDRYPYAARMSGINYMRNSVKVVVDAYDGSINAYISDPDDPLIETMASIFPDILRPFDDMPADLRAHIRYPTGFFRAQAELYASYHVLQPDVFYFTEDQWQFPTQSGQSATTDPFVRHMIMKLPGEAREEFIVMTPFTPKEKHNLTAWMVARNDGERYGELVVYRFPRQSLVFGPQQITDRISQNTEISRQITLWDQSGSEVHRGNLLVIPIEEALVYVQPLYLQAEGGRIPELKRVIVAYENQVVMEETLTAGLSRLFGDGMAPRDAGTEITPTTTPSTATQDVPTLSDLIVRASEHYDRAVSAQRAGDWAAYGREIEQVGALLRQIQQLTSGEAASGQEP